MTTSSSQNQLHLLCCSRSPAALEAVRSLLSKGHDPRARVDGGLTALHAAAANDSLAICQLLIHFGADPCAKDELGRTPLSVATGNTKIYLKRYISNHRKRPFFSRVFVRQKEIHVPDEKQSFAARIRSRVSRFFKKDTKKNVDTTSDSIATPIRRETSTKPSIVMVTPHQNIYRLPPKNPAVPAPSAPRLYPELPTEVFSNGRSSSISRRRSSRRYSLRSRRGRIAANVPRPQHGLNEESLDVEELKERLSKLQIGDSSIEKIDEKEQSRIKNLNDTELKSELQSMGIPFGPICYKTRPLYEKKLLSVIG